MKLSTFKNLRLIDLIKGFEGIRVRFEHCCKLLIGKRFIFPFGHRFTDFGNHIFDFLLFGNQVFAKFGFFQINLFP